MKKINLYPLIIAFFFSSNVNAQWQKITDNRMSLDGSFNYVDGYDGSIIAVLGNSGAFLSADTGNTWVKKLNQGYPGITTQFPTCAIGNKYIYCFNYTNSLFFSNDGGDHWVSKAMGDSLKITCIDAQDSVIAVGTDQKGLFFSTDYGVNWTHLDDRNYAIYGKNIKKVFVQKGYIYMINELGLLAVGSKGLSSMLYSNSLPSASLQEFLYFPPAKFYLGTTQGLYYLNDANTWEVISSDIPISVQNSVNIEALVAYRGTLICSTAEHDIFFSRDNGVKWFSFNKGLSVSGGGTQLLKESGFGWNEIVSLKITDGYLFGGTLKSTEIYRRPLDQLNGLIYLGDGLLVAPYVKDAAYTWYKDDEVLSATDYYYQASANGLYKVEIVYNIDAPTTATKRTSVEQKDIYTFNVTDLVPTAVLNKAVSKISLSPNPSNGNIRIISDENLADKNYTIINALGIEVEQGIVSKDFMLYMEKFAKGIYSIRIISGENIYVAKVVLE